MKTKVILLSLFIVFSLINIVHSEAFVSWNELTIKSNELKIPFKVQLSRNGKILSIIEVEIDNKVIRVPPKSLKKAINPQLNTTTIGYWNPEVLDFYIGIECGVPSSFPGQPQPKIVFFIFNNGQYSHYETYDVLDTPSHSLELYQLIKRKPVKRNGNVVKP
jgi:hypothetical protein